MDHIDNYEWLEGEVFGGSIIGWNFGDGHLNFASIHEGRSALSFPRPVPIEKTGLQRSAAPDRNPFRGASGDESRLAQGRDATLGPTPISSRESD